MLLTQYLPKYGDRIFVYSPSVYPCYCAQHICKYRLKNKTKRQIWTKNMLISHVLLFLMIIIIIIIIRVVMWWLMHASQVCRWKTVQLKNELNNRVCFSFKVQSWLSDNASDKKYFSCFSFFVSSHSSYSIPCLKQADKIQTLDLETLSN